MHALLDSGPAAVAAALDAIGWPARGADPQAPDGRPAPLRPEQALADCLGLTGAVALGDHLDRTVHAPRPRPDAAQAELDAATHRLVTDMLSARRTRVRERIERRYRSAFEGRHALPDAQAMWSALGEAGALPARAPGPLAEAAARLQGPFRQHLGAQLALARKELRFLREDVHAALAKRSDYGRTLLALDALLEPGLSDMLQRCHARAVDGAAQRFAQRLVEAVVALPEATDDAAALQAWFAPRGWVSRYVSDCRRLCMALLDAEHAGLQALVDACCAPVAPSMHPVAAREPDQDDVHDQAPARGPIAQQARLGDAGEANSKEMA